MTISSPSSSTAATSAVAESLVFRPRPIPGLPFRRKKIRGTYLGITERGFLKMEAGGKVLELPSAEDVRKI